MYPLVCSWILSPSGVGEARKRTNASSTKSLCPVTYDSTLESLLQLCRPFIFTFEKSVYLGMSENTAALLKELLTGFYYQTDLMCTGTENMLLATAV